MNGFELKKKIIMEEPMKKFLALLVAAVMCVSMGAVAFADAADDLVSEAFIDPINDWAKYDEMIAEIKAETDFAKRTELMHKAEEILMYNYYFIPMY